MKFLPRDHFILYSLRSADELRTALRPHIRKPNFIQIMLWPIGKKAEQRFEGAVDIKGFKIWPVIRYQNSFLPIIVGAFRESANGTTISVRQRLSPFVKWFSVVWATFVLLFLGFAIINPDNIENAETLWEARLIPVIMIGFLWCLANGAFWWEARHTKDELKRILDAHEHPTL